MLPGPLCLLAGPLDHRPAMRALDLFLVGLHRYPVRTLRTEYSQDLVTYFLVTVGAWCH